MSTSLTPLRRRQSLFGRRAATALAVDDHAAAPGADAWLAPPDMQAGAAAMDAGDSSARMVTPDDVERARMQGFDSGSRFGAVRRTWWDLLVGAVWTVSLLAAITMAAGAAGYVSVVFFPTQQPEARPAAAEPAAQRRVIDDWADRT